jgi:Protein kinase domain/Septum formation
LAALQAGDPQRVGPYVLLGRLGSGGMGRVYLARSPGGRMVAVKVIRANLAEDAGFRRRFAREVAAARKVGGLFTAQVVDADTDGPVPWLVTAYVPGTSLSDAVEQQGPLPETSVLALAAGLAEGLIAIHAAGVIHRDLKPSNVLLAQDGPRIIDFGISSAADATALTGTGFMIGSPGFMSPEQAEGLVVGPASDIFSLAGVLIYAARGEGPFGTGDTAALLYRVVHGKPNIDHVPGHLRPLIERSLSRDPQRRPTAAEFLADLSAAYPAAADLSNWLPPQVLDLAAAGHGDLSLHPPASGAGSMAGGSMAGGSAAGSAVVAGSGNDRFHPAMADPVPPVPDAMAPMALAAEAMEAGPREADPATSGNATLDPPTRTTVSPQTPPPPTTAAPPGYQAPQRGSQGFPGPQSYADPAQPGYPGSQGYQGQQGYSGQPAYPGQPGYSGQPGYPGSQGYAAPQGYPGQQQYPEPQGYRTGQQDPVPPGYQQDPVPPGYQGGPGAPQGGSWWSGQQPGGTPQTPLPEQGAPGGPAMPGSGQWYGPPAGPVKPKRPRWLLPAGGAAVILVVVVVLVLALGSGGSHNNGASQSPPATPTRTHNASPTPSATPTTGNLTLAQLRVGDCLTGTNLDLNLNTPWPKLSRAVPCSQGHTAEVFLANSSFFPKGGSYPGDATIKKDATAGCNSAFQSYVGIAYQKSQYTWTDIVPDASTWPGGDRALHCVVYYATSSQPAGVTLHGSLKGADR